MRTVNQKLSNTVECGTLHGAKEISAYLGISLGALWRWRRLHALPVAVMPDGSLMITRTLIDQWLLARIDCKGRLSRSPGRPRTANSENQSVTGDSSSERRSSDLESA